MKEINDLIQKYWEGQTTLEEEKQLHSHFSKEAKSGYGTPEEALFSFFEAEKAKVSTGVINLPKKKEAKLFKLSYIRAIAAGLALVMGSWWAVQHFDNAPKKITIEDPEVALQVTKEALTFLKEKVNKGEEKVKDNIIHLDKTFIFKN